MVTGYAQMRLVTGFEIVNHALSMALIVGTAGIALWLWTQRRRSASARSRRPRRWRCA